MQNFAAIQPAFLENMTFEVAFFGSFPDIPELKLSLLFHNDNFSPYLRHGFPLMFQKLFAVDALFTSRLWRAIQLRFNEKVACLSGESRVSVILVGEM